MLQAIFDFIIIEISNLNYFSRKKNDKKYETSENKIWWIIVKLEHDTFEEIIMEVFWLKLEMRVYDQLFMN